MNEVVSEVKKPWQTPQAERLDVAATKGANFPFSDSGALANTAFPNPS